MCEMNNMNEAGKKMTILQSIREALRKIVQDKNLKTSRKTGVDIEFPLIVIDDIEYTSIKEKINTWRRYVDYSIGKWYTNSHFIYFFLGGQLIASENPTTQNTQASNLMKGIIYKKTWNQFVDRFNNGNIRSKHPDIYACDVLLGILYDCVNYVLNKKMNISNDELCDSMKEVVKKHKLAGTKVLEENNGVKLTLFLILSFFSDISGVVNGDYNRISYSNLMDFFFEQKKEPWQKYNEWVQKSEQVFFHDQVMKKATFIGSEGSLDMMYYGAEYLKYLRGEEPYDEEVITKMDSTTLVVCSSLYYYSLNSSIEHPFQNAFDLSKKAYELGDRYMAAFYCGFYLYHKAIEMNKSDGKEDQRFTEIECELGSDGDCFEKAIEYLIQACENNNGMAYNLIGNIISKSYCKISKKSRCSLKSYYNKLLRRNTDNLHLEKCCDNNEIEMQYVFYRKANESGSMYGKYNYCKLLEKIIVIETKNEKSIAMARLQEELKSNLEMLYKHKHALGVNLYWQHYIYYKSTTIISEEDEEIFGKIKEKYKTLLPWQWSENNVAPLMFAPGTHDNWKEKMIRDLHYVSSYAYEQMVYFFPAYHCCLMNWLVYGNTTEGNLKKPLEYFRESIRILFRIVDEHKMVGTSYQNCLKSTTLLLKIVNVCGNDYEKDRMYALYLSNIHEIRKFCDENDIQVLESEYSNRHKIQCVQYNPM